MGTGFSATLAQLRNQAGLSQRKLAADLNISQALLSHYENGSREPGLPFICKVCDYFGVSADFLLGRGESEGSEKGGAFAAAGAFHKSLEAFPEDMNRDAYAFLDAAFRRISAHVHNRRSPLEAAQAAVDMAEAELRLLQTLSRGDN